MGFSFIAVLPRSDIENGSEPDVYFRGLFLTGGNDFSPGLSEHVVYQLNGSSIYFMYLPGLADSSGSITLSA